MRLQGRTALITGASSGIGAACARRLGAEGADLVLWARRTDRLEEIANDIRSAHGRNVHVAAVDVRDRDLVNSTVAQLVRDGIIPDLLLNNAGLASGLAPFHESDPDDWDRMIDTNIKGLLNVSRAVIPHMVSAGRGQVINIGSTAAHMQYPRGNVYSATKFAVRALSDGMNIDLVGTPVRVTNIDPGFVETEFSVVRFHGDQEKADNVYKGFRPLTGADVADTVAYVAALPEHMNILDMIVVPAAQKNIYVVDRNS
jgi:NADP-dependent 3-hydroxy acid dehydrogenase YdfG